MNYGLIMSGIGGQGIILAGKMTCSTAANKGYLVTLTPAYGQEKRGGRTSCQVVISDELGSPVISEADMILVMDDKSLKDYENRVKKGGYLIINSSMVKNGTTRTDINVVRLPINDIAIEVGNPKTANMVALGVLMKYFNFISVDDLKKQLDKEMKPKMVEINKIAVQKGYEYVG